MERLTHIKHATVTWRGFMSAVAAVGMSAAHPLHAHDGPHSPDVLIRVERAVHIDTSVEVELAVTSLGGPLTLRGLRAKNATSVKIAPTTLPFAKDVAVSAALEFKGTPPARFDLVLDFGPVGQGSVVVIPNHAEDVK